MQKSYANESQIGCQMLLTTSMWTLPKGENIFQFKFFFNSKVHSQFCKATMKNTVSVLEATNCGEPANIIWGSITYKSARTLVDDSATIICLPGFELANGQDKVILTCLDDGNWTSPNTSCQSKYQFYGHRASKVAITGSF